MDISLEQKKRQKSAEQALALGQWSFTACAVGWQVKTPIDTYTITEPLDGQPVCSCPDHQRFGYLGAECKHLCGLRTWLQNPTNTTQGEIIMSTDSIMRECGWVKLFHPSSAQVTIPLLLEKPLLVTEAQALLASVSSLLQAGFSVEPPGLEEGEHEEEIGFVVKRSKLNADDTETPVIDLYPSRGNFRLLARYLNNDNDILEFEKICRVNLASLPLYEGDKCIERGKNPKLDKYVTSLMHPVKVIWKPNPRYEGQNDKKNAKRLFVRWADLPLNNRPNDTLGLNGTNDTVICPMGSKSHPEFKGIPLEQVAQTEDGRMVLKFLAGDQYPVNGDPHARAVKTVANQLLEAA
jgi:hypothetical protein